jgi:WD40 repeat protein
LVQDANQRVSEAEVKERNAVQRAKVASVVFSVTLVGTAIASGLAWKAVKDGEEAKVGTRLERAGLIALRRFDTDQAEGLRLAMRAGFELKKWVGGKSPDQYPSLSPILALQSSLERMQETKLPTNRRITRVAFSPDGKTLATMGHGKDYSDTIDLWGTDGKSIASIQTNQRKVTSVAFSPDGKTLATGGDDGSIKFWGTDGKYITTIHTHQNSIRSVAFSPDGRVFATGGNEGSIKLWDTDNKLITTIHTNHRSVLDVEFISDGKILATRGGDDSIKLWDTNGKLITTIHTNQGNVTSMAFSPDSKILATVGDNSTKIWGTDGKPITTLQTNQRWATSVAFSPDGS